MRRWVIVNITLWTAIATLFSSCSVIDEDMSDCGEELKLYYDLHLVTNFSIELQKELDRRTDATLVNALRDYLSPVFTDYAHDLDLSFYDHLGENVRLHREQHIMDANELSCTINMPRRQYIHTAVANLEHNSVVTLEGSDFCHTAQFIQSLDNIVSPHNTGLFSARKEINLEKGRNDTYEVHMYMANCSAALVLDTSDATLKDLKVVATGFASRFNIADSIYVFADTPSVVLADKIETGKDGLQCFCTVNFPSREEDVVKTRTVIETEEPFFSEDAQNSLWQFRVYATLPDGKVTESVLGVKKPLRAAQFKILHAHVYSNGGLEPDEPEVAVSITLDWKDAGNYVVPL